MHRDKKRAVALVDGGSARCTGEEKQHFLMKVFELPVAVLVVVILFLQKESSFVI